MKISILSSIIFITLMVCSQNIQAQNRNSKKSSDYYERLAQQYLKKADQAIIGIGGKYNALTPYERNMQIRIMNGDKKAEAAMIQHYQKKHARLNAANNAYNSRYNKRWSSSFNTFGHR